MTGPDELVDWVGEDDEVIAVVRRERMRRERLLHRAVFVAVIDGQDRVVVHQRAAWKDVWPSAWDVCFGGVVAAGESWADAARRELVEETGLEAVEPAPMGGPFAFSDERVALLGRAYLVRTDRSVSARDGEVVAVDRVSRANLVRWSLGRTVCPDSLHCVLPLICRAPSASRG
jgi:8-oxo-dGTP pyrophosphatase MutT (NUDIX family)